jgi:hypothetical protein
MVQNLKPSSPKQRQISKLLKRYVVSVQCEPSVYLARSHVRNQSVFGAASYLKMVLLFRQSAKLGDQESLPENILSEIAVISVLFKFSGKSKLK